MRDNIRSINPGAPDYLDLPWFVGQRFVPLDERRAEHFVLPDAYHHEIPTSGVTVNSDTKASVVKHVLICVGGEGDDVRRSGVVADVTGVLRYGQTLNKERSPRGDADLAEYICKLHNDALASRKA